MTAPELIPPGRLTRRELAQLITERWRAGCDAMLSTIFAVADCGAISKVWNDAGYNHEHSLAGEGEGDGRGSLVMEAARLQRNI